ncbi:hypothetical protein ACIA78_31835 [Streptomyces xanthochromogenes]|uniref:hypothetical protein n=1 Tax=Streptomyces xanthochromogenes TaxID=67384 RepID=UPI00342C6F21
MNSEDLLALIRAHWPDIHSALDDEQRELLLTRLEALAVAPADERAVRRCVQGVRLALLALPPGHLVRRALDGTRLAVPAVAAPDLTATARELLAQLTDPSPPPHRAGGLAEARQRLLSHPSLSPEQARHRCAGAVTGLIRLDDPVRGPRYPAFQFGGADGGPLPVVRTVNRLLLGDEDPWGAADWWLSGNLWLGGRPAALLGRVSDELLVGAASAMLEAD